MGEGASVTFLKQAAASVLLLLLGSKQQQCNLSSALICPGQKGCCSDLAVLTPCPLRVRNSLVFFLEPPDDQLAWQLGHVGVLHLFTLHHALDGKFYWQQDGSKLVLASGLFCLVLLFIFLLLVDCEQSGFHRSK